MKKNRTKKPKTYTIALLYHHFPKTSHPQYYSEEHALVDGDTTKIVQYMHSLFLRRKYHVQVIKVQSGDLSNLKKLKAHFVFNLVDSRALELKVARILDRLNIPHSGSSFTAIQTSNNKLRTKRLFQKHQLPTPAFTVLYPKDRLNKRFIPEKFPVIVKPAFEHCSIGITEHSIVTNYRQFQTVVKALRAKFKQPLLVESFIPGKEFQVTVLETYEQTAALPIAEITFKRNIKNKWNIYGFDEKWRTDLPIYKSCQFISPPRHLRKDIDAQIKRDAIRAFYALGFHDYARFDLRYNDTERRWYFLEGNANAGFGLGAGDAMTASINAYGMTLDDFILQIVKNSLS